MSGVGYGHTRPKTERNQQVYDLYKEGDITYKQLAKDFRVTVCRISQIIKNINDKKKLLILNKERRDAYLAKL